MFALYCSFRETDTAELELEVSFCWSLGAMSLRLRFRGFGPFDEVSKLSLGGSPLTLALSLRFREIGTADEELGWPFTWLIE